MVVETKKQNIQTQLKTIPSEKRSFPGGKNNHSIWDPPCISKLIDKDTIGEMLQNQFPYTSNHSSEMAVVKVTNGISHALNCDQCVS